MSWDKDTSDYEVRSYTPIEDSCTDWLYARTVISSLIPMRLEFIVLDDHHTLAIDCTWRGLLCLVAPEAHRHFISHRLTLVQNQLASVVSVKHLVKILPPLSMSGWTLGEVNKSLHVYNTIRHQRGYATCTEIAKHILGIKQTHNRLDVLRRL